MAQRNVFDGGDAAARQTQWDMEVRVRALARLGQRTPRRAWIAPLAVLSVLHALMFWRWYANRFELPPVSPTVVEMRLIEEAVPPPALPVPRSPQRPTLAAAVPRPAAPSPMAAAILAAAPPQPKLFNRDGTVQLPPSPRFSTPLDAGIARGRELLARGHNLIHCRRSRFDGAPTPAQTATAAAKRARMAHSVMGNPLDPLNDVGEQQTEDAAGERAAEKRRIEEQACDY